MPEKLHPQRHRNGTWEWMSPSRVLKGLGMGDQLFHRLVRPLYLGDLTPDARGRIHVSQFNDLYLFVEGLRLQGFIPPRRVPKIQSEESSG